MDTHIKGVTLVMYSRAALP